MKTVYITVGEHPTSDYPFAVCVLDDDPDARIKRYQDHMCRSLQDARLFANGMCAASRFAGQPGEWSINPVVDPRLQFRD